MRRLAAGLLCVLLCLVPLALRAAAAGETVVDRYEADCAVDANGRAVMTVTVDLTIPSPVTELEFPIGAGTDASIAGLDARRVKTDDGAALRVSSEAGISGSRTFVITYTLSRVVSEQEAGQTLSLDLIAPGWQWPITEAAFSVAMPAAFTGSPAYTGGYYGDVVEDYLDLQCDGVSFSGAFTEPLRDHDSLSVTLALPSAYVDLQSANGISALVTLILVTLLSLLAVLYWYRTLRNPRVPVRLRPLPPDGAGAGDLPMLVSCASPSLPLQVIQWAGMGYLAVHINAKNRIVLRQSMPMGTERRSQERAVFAKLFEKDPWCDGESLRFGRLSGRYAAAMERWWTRRLFSRTSGSPALLHLTAMLASGAALLGAASAGLPVGRLRGVLLALLGLAGAACGLAVQRGVVCAARRRFRPALLCAAALVALLTMARIWGGLLPMALSLLLQVFAAVATLRGGRRSPGGRDSLAQTLGFRRYLQHVSQHQLILQLRDDSQYFYEMLPYAEAMGLGAEFAAKFGELELEPCAWYETQGRPASTAPAFYRAFRETLSRMEAAEKKA